MTYLYQIHEMHNIGDITPVLPNVFLLIGPTGARFDILGL